MAQTPYDHLSVGEIAAKSPSAAALLDRFNVDFCCHGKTVFPVACALAGHTPEEVAAELDKIHDTAEPGKPDFLSWPTDLLADYVLKIHHRGIRREGPAIIALFNKVKSVHGEHHPELFEVANLFEASFNALSQHLIKEERVLFPYIYQLCAADLNNTSAPAFHCAGSVTAPVHMMEMEHADEGERQARIEELTSGFTTPADGCASYKLLMEKLKAFRDALHEHIHLENNIIFPRAIDIEGRRVEQ